MTREQVAVKGIPRDQLRGFPDIGQDELIRFFTLTPADVEFVASRRARGPAQGLGLAVQLCTLPWLGFVPDEVRAAPPVAVARLGARLKVDAGVLACYGAREQTRTDHLLAVTDFLGWKSAPAAGWRPGSWRSSWGAGRWSTIPRRCCVGVPQSMSPPRSEDPGVIDPSASRGGTRCP